MEVDESPQKYGAAIMTSIQNLFSTTSSSVKKLLGLAQCSEDDKWAAKAVEYLVKRLRRKPGAVDDLLYAVQNPQVPSKCVTILRSLDGRLQVFHRKGLPHVIYCKLWRWPDLHSYHQLRPLECCKHPYSSKLEDEICINPYHYRLHTQQPLEDVMVPNNLLDESTANDLLQALDAHQDDMKSQIPQNYSLQFDERVEQNPDVDALWSDNDLNAYLPMSPPVTDSSACSSPLGQSWSPQSFVSNDLNNTDNKENIPTNNQYQFQQYRDQQYNQQLQQQQQQQLQPQQEQFYNEQSQNYDQYCQQQQYYFSVEQQQQQQPQLQQQQQQQQQITAIPYQEPSNWASIAYYEMNNRIGEIYQCSYPVITVDGFTDPTTSQRFSIGKLTSVHRNDTIEKTRIAIGHGIQLHHVNGAVHVECSSDHSIFVQSRNCNHERDLHPITVLKVPSKYSLKIFDNHVFCELLKASVQQGFEAVYELTKMCTIRMSFVKGWGAEYQRQDVTATPCWIEIHLNGPLKWLDNVLTSMGSPQFRISSVS